MKTIAVDRSKLEEVCERAAKYHRLQMADHATPLELTYEITGVPTRSPMTIQPDGWAKIGVVHDAVELWDLAVWWRPDTDKIKLEKPPQETVPDLPAPSLAGPPLYRTVQGSPASASRPFVALPGWIYSYRGREYAAAEAEQLVTELGSLEGWTWRPED